ncbi:MAG: hypothetical protein K9M99_05160 [Candidatus Cloacimonetes bacterium]|nr:hypothetical protein [Candidatus Cloacimonadota bacterium]
MSLQRLIFNVIIALLFCLLLMSCDSRDEEYYSEISFISIIPDTLYADNNEETYSNIEVIITDNNGNPVPGKHINFESDLGYIQLETYSLDDGHASAVFHDNGIPGIAHIYASLENENQVFSDSLKILSVPFLITFMSEYPDLLWADGSNNTFSEIRVGVEDMQGFPAPGIPVHFSTDLGCMPAQAYTNDAGVALTYFNEEGIPGTAHISAWIDEDYGQVVKDSIEIIPLYQYSIQSITANPDTIYADNGITSSTIEIMVQDQYGTPVADLDVWFLTDIGCIISHVNTDHNGIAATNFWDDGNTGIATIRGFAGTAIDTIHVSIIENEVISFWLNEIPDLAAVNTLLLVTAAAQNEYGAVPDGKEIFFTTEMGFFQVSENDNTSLGTSISAYTENGSATAYLNTGEQTGFNQVSAQISADIAGTILTDSAELEIMPAWVSEIVLPMYDINIFACNDNSYSAGIHIELRDVSGNLVLDPSQVWVKFLTHPQGSNIENIVYNLSDSTSVISSEGEALVYIYSGPQTGIIAIQAWVRNPSGQMISAVCENIMVVPGMPANCELSMDGIDESYSYSEGYWNLEISAYITDDCGNPAADGMATYFYMDPEPDYASLIFADAYIGNENQQGNSLPGMSFASITFDGAFTNEVINLKIDMGNNFNFEEEFTLPLQFGELSMICTPIHLDWIEENDEDDKLTQCRVTVHDGQQNPVNKQRVMFFSTAGFHTDENIHPIESDITDPEVLQLYDWQGLNEDDDPYDGFTGWYEGDHGLLYKYAGFHKYECPPPVPAPPGMTTVVINAIIADTQISVSQAITLLRYTD